MALEKIVEKQAVGQIRTSVGEELSGSLVVCTPGARLDAGLAADQEWRKRREEKLRQGLRKAWICGEWARTGSVAAGLLEWAMFACVGVGWLLPEGGAEGVWITLGLAWSALLTLGLAWSGLLTFSGVAAVYGGLLRRRLLTRAKQEAVAVPEPASQPRQSMETETPAGQERAHRTDLLRKEIERIYSEESTLGDVCLWAAYVSLVSWGLFGLGLLSDSGQSVFALVFLVWVAIVTVLPVAALAYALMRRRRKPLLRKAAAEGLEVRDPARCPWE